MYGSFGYAGFTHLRSVADASAAASRAASRGRQAADAVRSLEERLDKLVLVNTALWELVKEKTGLTDEELSAKVQQLDLADGRQDGKVTREIQECQNCGRTLSRRHSRCMYCGAERLRKSVFDGAS